ncbi:MAG: right-handed parallel beta-helix repeat-containing protein [Planctomycetota bacterium]
MKKLTARTFFTILLLTTSAALHASKVVVAEQPSPAAVDFDVQGFVDGRLKAGERRVVVPPGRYRVAPKNGVHLRLKDLTDVELIADGVEIVCAHTTRVVVFEKCRNVLLRGLTVDFDPLPFTQSRIVALGPDKKWVEFEIIEGYPENELEERIEIFDPATGELRRKTSGWEKQIEPLGNHRYRATKPKSYRYREDWDTERVGDILVTNNCFPSRATGHAFSAEDCMKLKIEDVTLYAASMFGFVEHRCDGSTYLRCKIVRRASENDLVKRAAPRMRSLNADAFHSTEAGQGPAIVGCTAKFQGDDCVNIHGSYHLVTVCEGAQLRIAVLRRNTIEPGDPVEFLPFTGPRPPDAVAVKIEPDAPITEAEKEFVRKLSLHAPHKERLLDSKAAFFKLTLDRAVPLTAGSAVCSGRRIGNGFLVKDCDFGHNRSRGILIKASRGQVVGNRISHGWMAAVLVAPEFWWLEAASSSDVEIRDNVIVGCRRPAIEIIALGGNGKPLPSGAHRNIVIAGNRITDSAWPNIYATSTERLVVEGNHLTPAEPRDFAPPLAHPWNWGANAPTAIVTELCEGAVVQTPPKR